MKAVDLIQRMPIIPRPGGSHFLKPYLATFGVIFTASGLQINKTHDDDELAADSILNGNSYVKAI